MDRTMLNESMLLDNFWRGAIYTTFHILKRGQLRMNGDKTPYHF